MLARLRTRRRARRRHGRRPGSDGGSSRIGGDVPGYDVSGAGTTTSFSGPPGPVGGVLGQRADRDRPRRDALQRGEPAQQPQRPRQRRVGRLAEEVVPTRPVRRAGRRRARPGGRPQDPPVRQPLHGLHQRRRPPPTQLHLPQHGRGTGPPAAQHRRQDPRRRHGVLDREVDPHAAHRDIACAASPISSSPSAYQRRSRSRRTSSSLTSSNDVSASTRSATHGSSAVSRAPEPRRSPRRAAWRRCPCGSGSRTASSPRGRSSP